MRRRWFSSIKPGGRSCPAGWPKPKGPSTNLRIEKTAARPPADASDMIGIFPVLSQTPERLVAGFDDKHLDFRVIVDVSEAAGRRRVTATTLVLTHNLLGRAYLAAILPFHRVIVRTMVAQAAGPIRG